MRRRTSGRGVAVQRRRQRLNLRGSDVLAAVQQALGFAHHREHRVAQWVVDHGVARQQRLAELVLELVAQLRRRYVEREVAPPGPGAERVGGAPARTSNLGAQSLPLARCGP
jgi:hypothetical protein